MAMFGITVFQCKYKIVSSAINLSSSIGWAYIFVPKTMKLVFCFSAKHTALRRKNKETGLFGIRIISLRVTTSLPTDLLVFE